MGLEEEQVVYDEVVKNTGDEVTMKGVERSDYNYTEAREEREKDFVFKENAAYGRGGNFALKNNVAYGVHHNS